MKKQILLVDDEEKIISLLKDYMEMEGYSVITALDGTVAMEKYNLNRDNLELVVLDIMLPGINGWEICKEIRKVDSLVPILMLTARSEDYDEIHGLEIGADDFIRKPIKPSILMARVKSLLRRKNSKEKSRSEIVIGDLYIDRRSHVVKVGIEEISLTPKEYDILILLVEENGRVISREELLNAIWDYDYFGDYRTVDTHVNRLRTKLLHCQDVIHTVRGFGYRAKLV